MVKKKNISSPSNPKPSIKNKLKATPLEIFGVLIGVFLLIVGLSLTIYFIVQKTSHHNHEGEACAGEMATIN